jgi:drug/metabolite transporter (DMT)-like permease
MKAIYKADLSLLGITFVWGSTFVIIKEALSGISPFLFIAIRFALATLIIGLIFRKRLFNINKETLLAGSVIGAFLFLGVAFQTFGLKYTLASKSAFITGSAVVIVPLLSIFVEKVVPKVSAIFGAILAGIGLWVLTNPRGAAFNRGDLLTIVCAVFFASQIIFVEIYTRRLDFIKLVFAEFLAVTILSSISAFAFENIQIIFSSYVVVAILIISIPATALALTVQMWAQRITTATRVGIIFTTEPIFAMMFAYILAQEIFGTFEFIGAAIILIGMLMAELGRK